MAGIQLVARKKRSGVELNMSPLIDMVFILLIFFLVTTSFVKESAVEVKRPINSNAPTTGENTNLFIVIDSNGYISIDNQMVDIRNVRSHAERWFVNNPMGNVIIAADKASRWGIAVEALDQVRAVGIKNVVVTQKAG